jgi:hypothetical protein
MRHLVTIGILGLCLFAGSFLGSHYMHSQPAQAATAKGPSTAVLAARIVSLSHRVKTIAARTETLGSDLSKLAGAVNGSPDENSYSRGLQGKVASLWATVYGAGYVAPGVSFDGGLVLAVNGGIIPAPNNGAAFVSGLRSRVDSLEPRVNTLDTEVNGINGIKTKINRLCSGLGLVRDPDSGLLVKMPSC